MSSMVTRLVIVAVIVWLVIIIVMSGPFLRPGGLPEDQVVARLNRAIDELEELKHSNAQLRLVVQAFTNGNPIDPSNVFSTAPPKDYEVYRRRAENDIRELWFFARSQLDKLIRHAKEISKDTLKALREGIYERHMAALIDMDAMRLRDGYERWRRGEAQALHTAVMDRIRTLQNPADCFSAKKLICTLNKGCGYGCQLHHATYCLVMSISMKRTLILKSKGWRYNPRGFEDVFQPLSNSCLVETGGNIEKYPGSEDTINVELPIIDSINPRPAQLPLAVPKALAARIQQLHGNPALWWISQLLGFLQRPQKETAAFLKQVEQASAIKKPYVGIHVRRTDKIGTEASYHGIEEYMSWAIEYFDKYELAHGRLDKRRVYIASDDDTVLKDARSLYPNYEFFGDQKIAASASLKNRYTVESLRGVIADLHMLSMSDHLVCTFSSQVCRVAFEMMQLLYPDASHRFRSLDDIFYYGGQKDHNVVAVLDHSKANARRGEIVFRKGDLLGIAGNHWDGFSRGVNRRTLQKGLFPSFKTTDFVDAVDFGDF
ncbi:alpha-(1,6)-fucosyltransferase-like isoform X1 [Varroa jacobsoni]|uniref:GT23 domain-containing protein n=1 Tax=Varroa destructor TaxID=109461 RepID=A0A7M7IXT2_VARDE|nr:alpha-(1,6)-fucosyltransferase-like isoform X2 [Varroa destructor]XP_022694837.1 alpha-(1,6)-fucosyltransferase-like isoform X1 [Varroa jacobsoni]XP_022694845.1 alpha-(1,6)-fucosyltransferase-like isoform X1 [Varroa jacobsoni]XP_022694852.1 alpha-(1,6)-fucosyltransferase-like isoform X1 [Varroa jacobsoni]